MENRALTGVLLVGGASRRFGSAKALASFAGTTLAERAWRVLGEACDERLAFGKAGDELALPFPVRDDGIELRAPIAGVVAGLRAAANEVCVFLPVDVPLVTPALVRALGESCLEAAVTQTGPLPAAITRSGLPVFERRLRRSELTLRDALAELETALVLADPSLLVNVNAPRELTALRSSSCRSASSASAGDAAAAGAAFYPATGRASTSTPRLASTRSRSRPVPISDTSTSSRFATKST